MCDALDVVCFIKIDIEWLEEYIKVLEPLANCLDILQGEKNMYLGYLIPSINQLIKKYVTMKNDVYLKICGPLIPILIENLEKRFEAQLNDTFLIIASVSHPFFKIEWFENNVLKDIAINKFKSVVIEVYKNNTCVKESELEVVEQDDKSMSNYDNHNTNFFPWMSKKKSLSSVENELSTYFEKGPTTQLNSLFETPNILIVFLKYNSPLPSSAAVERDFSIASAVLTKKRGRMSDENFEKIMMLKYSTI